MRDTIFGRTLQVVERIEPVLVDIGPISDKTLEPVLTQVWLA